VVRYTDEWLAEHAAIHVISVAMHVISVAMHVISVAVHVISVVNACD